MDRTIVLPSVPPARTQALRLRPWSIRPRKFPPCTCEVCKAERARGEGGA